MKIIEQIQRLKYIHELIEKKGTGTPEEFARKLRISRRQLYYIIDELKLMSAPIEYDVQLKTFFYSQKCQINISFDIDVLSEEEICKVSGGGILFNRYSADYIECKRSMMIQDWSLNI